MEIHSTALAILDSASDKGVVAAMQRVASSFTDEHWLANGHQYRRAQGHDGDRSLAQDLAQGCADSLALAEYIAVSSPTHAMDGWGLLGRSVHSFLRGDQYTATHLAYYSELRAALALLAAQGIGIFDRKHAVVLDSGECREVNPLNDKEKAVNNHQWTWLVFRWWTQEQKTIELLRRIIRPSQEDLGEWLDSTNKAKFALDPVGRQWLAEWGLDIRRFFADRDVRNAASYWPNTLNAWDSREFVEDLRLVADMWRPLEPTLGNRFANIDRHLLRNVLKRGYFGVSADEASSPEGVEGFEAEIRDLLETLGKDGWQRNTWQEFLSGQAEEELSAIEVAKGDTEVGARGQVTEVMARAMLLLRLATGAAAEVLSEAGVGRRELGFWVEAIGRGRGMWDEGGQPDEVVDLWAEVESGLEDADTWLATPDRGAYQTWAVRPRVMTLLGEYERVALWGLGL